jgi:S1-C subfamily serine protease
LTGPSKGQIFWLAEDVLSAAVINDRVLRIGPIEHGSEGPDCIAFLTWTQGSYRIEAPSGRHVWVNGHQIEAVELMHGDMIEFEEKGPMARFRLCDRRFPPHLSIEEIVGDAIAYARSSRRPFAGRMSFALGESLRRMTLQTTIFFRVSVAVILGLILLSGIVLYQNDKKLQRTLEQDARRIEAVTLLLAQTRDEVLSPNDLADLQRQLELRLAKNAERLGALELQSEAATRVIELAAPSVAFVQGAFGLRHFETGKLLRQVVDANGEPLKTPFGQPRIELEGNGPPAEFQFTGTGFLLESGQHLVTNRHVALPWMSGNKLQAFEASGLEPEMLKLVVYLPDITGPIDAELFSYSETSDLAVLSLAPTRIEDRGLSLTQNAARAGDEVYLLGYPTGLKALLAQAGPSFFDSFSDETEMDFWSVAAGLSDQNLIHPLASRGIVAQISEGIIVYDAETTVGGSGGPAMNRQGEVLAINAAILPEFGGANIGVPVADLETLLNQSD